MTEPTTPLAPAQEPKDLGFGTVVGRANERRLLNRDGSFNTRREGLPFWASLNAYHWVLNLSWSRFFGVVIAGYLLVNVIFSLGYLACGPDALGGEAAADFGGAFGRAFFFSVATIGTIGYGNVHPVGVAANILVTLESLSGLLGMALGTGLLFARFSRPTAKIRFSEVAVVTPYRGMTALMFRLANGRQSQLIELEAKVLFSRLEGSIRRYDQLALERTKVVFFPLAWTIVHPIDEKSPLWGLSAEELDAREAEFLVLLSGVDETFSQTVHARTSYKSSDVAVGQRFVNMYNPTAADGIVSVDVRKLSETEPALDEEWRHTASWQHTGQFREYSPDRR